MPSQLASTVVSGASPEAAEVVCVLVHGRTQSPADMTEMIVRHLAAPGVRFVMPKSAGTGWYDARAVDPLTASTRTQLSAALDHLGRTVAAAEAESPQARLVLAGFSQGACLSAEYLMRRGGWDGAACLFTACRVGTPEDGLPVADLGGMPVYASCGDHDPWIPAPAFNALCLALIAQTARLRTDVFPGREHTVTPTERMALEAMLSAVGAGRSVLDAGTATR